MMKPFIYVYILCGISTLSYSPIKKQQLPFSPCPFPTVLSLSPSYLDIIKLVQIFTGIHKKQRQS